MEEFMQADVKEFHSYTSDSVKWRLTQDGIEIQGDGSVKRTTGQPSTVKKIWTSYQTEITTYSKKYNIPIEIIIANIATESGGNTKAYREEPGFKSDLETPNKVSGGLMQTLLSTANQMLRTKLKTVDLFVPDVAIHAGASFIASQAFKTNLDPVLVPIAYNAGGLYPQKDPDNRFKLKMYPIGTSAHADRYILWFNDCRFAINSKYIDVPADVLTLKIS